MKDSGKPGEKKAVNGLPVRIRIETAIRSLGLRLYAKRTARWLTALTNPEFRRRDRGQRRRFREFKRQYEKSLGIALNGKGDTTIRPKALVLTIGFPEVEVELGLIKGLELAGFTPVVVIFYDEDLMRGYHRLAGDRELLYWGELTDPVDTARASSLINGIKSIEEFMRVTDGGLPVGRIALFTAMRRTRLGTFDLNSEADRNLLTRSLAESVASAAAARRIVKEVRPEVALFVDGIYTPQAELVEHCLREGVASIGWATGHRDNSLILKRFSPKNWGAHPLSLSKGTQVLVRTMPWTKARRDEIEREFLTAYSKGDWYSACGTQFNAGFEDPDAIRKQLGLDPGKKTAVIFPHIFWDISLTSGEDLFPGGYKAWFIETVRAAYRNTNVNWIVKIHPAHIGKALEEGYHGVPEEGVVMREQVGALPPHVRLMGPDTPINTYSVLGVADYCLTVRGTIGIEAARRGVPVLTAGTGRYSGLGFTIDSTSTGEYLHRLEHIQDIPPMSEEERERADRFAYATFVLRPLTLSTVTLEYPKGTQGDPTGKSRTVVHPRTRTDWEQAKDLQQFAEWVRSGEEDFLSRRDLMTQTQEVGKDG